MLAAIWLRVGAGGLLASKGLSDCWGLDGAVPKGFAGDGPPPILGGGGPERRSRFTS